MIHPDRRLLLPLILIATLAMWYGVSGIGLNQDDYQYIASMAPIRSVHDLVRPFYSPDANASYFRPFANMTMATDFLVYGWSGSAFHLTNLLFHLIATLLVFYVARDVFRLTERESLWTALLFGIAASHEYNLVVDTARADILVTIFVMAMLLCHRRSADSYWYTIAAMFSFAVALCSKEIAVVIIGMIPFVSVTKGHPSVKRRVLSVLPYLGVALIFYVYHAHFTASALASQPMTAEGAHSLSALFRNSIYSFGYALLPLDLETATSFITSYRIVIVVLGIVAAIVAILAVLAVRERLVHFHLPLLFTLLAGSILFLSFERWRIYLPSVGLLAMIVMIVNRAERSSLKILLVVASFALISFHLVRARSAVSEWCESTALRDRLKTSITHILIQNPSRPLTLGFITSPFKLGSAAVMQLGQSAVVQRAEADRLSVANRMTGTLTGANVDSWTAVQIFALDPNEGFRSITTLPVPSHQYHVAVPDTSAIRLYPSGDVFGGTSRRDMTWHENDTIATENFVDVVTRVVNGGIKGIDVTVLDTNALPVVFDRSSQFQLLRTERGSGR